MEASSIAAKPDVRGHLHGMWAAVAPAWGKNAEYADRRGAEVAEEMLDATDPQRGERALELACGPGGLGIAAAKRLDATGEVVLSDVVPEMAAIAAARAEEAGLTNVSAAVLDVEDIDEPDESYDVVLCREGLMFATDPARAVGEMRRVLRPGGRVAIATWGPRPANPWLAMIFDAVSAQIGSTVPPPGVPGPFSLDDSERLAGLLVGAGFEQVRVVERSVPLRAASFEEWWTRASALAGPLTKILASLPEEATGSLTERLRETVKPYETADGIELPGRALLSTARLP